MATMPQSALFRVGDRVGFDLVGRRLTGTIVEDHGPHGIRGRRLFRVEVPIDPDEPMTMYLTENEIEAIPPGSEPPPSIEPEKIIKYLISGGLFSMLRSNMPAQRIQPRVWLCLDYLGNVTYTFAPDRGIVGGETPPASAIWEGKIAASKREAVEQFLESFGLSRDDAQRVVRKVGTAK